MLQWLWFAALLFSWVIQPRAVQAQNNLSLDYLRIEIWPEYDRPDVLIIHRMSLAADVALPAQMSVRIPRAAGAPYNLAWEDMDGMLYNLSYTSAVQGEWLRITFTTPSAFVQLEYYDPRMEREGALRSFVYEWNGDFEVNNLEVSVQQPANASDMIVYPGFDEGITQVDGFVYYSNPVGKVDAGTVFRVNLNYTKPDDALSVGLLPVQPAQPLDGDTPGRVTASSLLPVFLIVIGGVVLVVIVSWFLVQRSKVSQPIPNRKRHARSRAQSTFVDPSQMEYCHQCGRRAAPGDTFCRTCGARLHKD
jgi:hypothetical protein